MHSTTHSQLPNIVSNNGILKKAVSIFPSRPSVFPSTRVLSWGNTELEIPLLITGETKYDFKNINAQTYFYFIFILSSAK